LAKPTGGNTHQESGADATGVPSLLLGVTPKTRKTKETKILSDLAETEKLVKGQNVIPGQ
jgi:hypothetical protein